MFVEGAYWISFQVLKRFIQVFCLKPELFSLAYFSLA